MKILTYPDKATEISKLYLICKHLGIELTNDKNDDYDISFHWSYKTISEPSDFCMYNRINDVSKQKVDKIFYNVFGYSIKADTTRKGYCIEKSNNQADHSGKIVKTPCTKKPNHVYQKLIDTRIDEQTIIDIRVPVFWGDIPFIYTNKRHVTDLFHKDLGAEIITEVYRPHDYFSEYELSRIKVFCKYIKLDFGALDVLRDSNGLIYIVDVNNIEGIVIFDRNNDLFKMYVNEFDNFIQSLH